MTESRKRKAEIAQICISSAPLARGSRSGDNKRTPSVKRELQLNPKDMDMKEEQLQRE